MAATEKRLGELHTKVAEVLIDALEGEELPGYTDEETGEIYEPKRMLPSAAIIAAATKFLKDNEITCAPSESNAIGELENKMAERRRRREAGVIDFAEAAKQAQFLAGNG